MLKQLLFLISNFVVFCVHAQQITFRKILQPQTSITNLKSFDGRQTSDGGYVLTGIANFSSSVEKPFLVKLNCKGAMLWSKSFANSGSWGNIFMRVIETKDSGFVMLNNTGSFNAYNILVVKTDKLGNTIWKKQLNTNLSNDLGQNIKQTKDGGYIICGATSSFGSDAGNASYTDAYFIKLDATGTIQWTKTIGNAGTLDDAKDIIEDDDGNFVFTGSFINKACFQIVFGKLDAMGNVLQIKTFGDTLSRSGGYAIEQLSTKDYIIFATTTIHNPSPNFNADISHCLFRVTKAGNLVWSKVFNGNNNSSDNSLSLNVLKNDEIILGTETMSYPSTGFTPNKQVGYRFSAQGNLIKTIGYNTTGSQYTKIHKANDNGFTLTGFTTLNSPIVQRTNIFKLDSNMASGCDDIDLTALTQFNSHTLNEHSLLYTTAQGGSSNNTLEGTFTLTDSTICESYPLINANYTAVDGCVGSPIYFNAAQVNANSYQWFFGNKDSLKSTQPSISYTYTIAGTYTTTLVVSNGCDADTQNLIIMINPAPALSITATPTAAVVGDIVSLNTNIVTGNFMWSTGSNTPTTTVNNSGVYYVTVATNGCTITDTILLNFTAANPEGIFIIPNAFSPNADGYQDKLVITATGKHKLIELQIYNRLGQKIFETKDINTQWDGKIFGELNDLGTYFYKAKVQRLGELLIFTGDITLIK